MNSALRRVAGRRQSSLSSVINIVHITPSDAGEDERIHTMVGVRQASGLSGPEESQNAAESYRLRRNSHQVVAYNRADNTMLGYVQGSLYETKNLLFNNTSYKPASMTTADMLVVDEVCVIKKAQGLGIAGTLLDECIRHSVGESSAATHRHTSGSRPRDATGTLITGFEDTSLTSVQFTVLTSNLSSEIMFTKFAQRHGTVITFGCCHFSNWGNYADWRVTLGRNVNAPSRPSHLSVRSNMYEIFSADSGVQGYFDRKGVIRRVSSYVANNVHGN